MIRAALILGLAAALLGCAGFGRSPHRAERKRLDASPQHQGRKFENPEPMYINAWGVLGGTPRGIQDKPEAPLPAVPRTRDEFDTPPKSGLRATWLGHSSVLLELDGIVQRRRIPNTGQNDEAYDPPSGLRRSHNRDTLQ